MCMRRIKERNVAALSIVSLSQFSGRYLERWTFMSGQRPSKMMRSRYFFIVVPLLLAILSACGGQNSGNNGGNATTNTTPIKIGYTVPRTGDFSGDGPFIEQGYQLWAKYINSHGGLLGRQVQLIGKDDASKPEQVTTDYRQFLSEDKVDLLFAPFAEALTLPAAIVAHQYGKVLVEGVSTEQDIYNHQLDNLFGVSLPAQQYIGTFSNYILSLPQAKRPTTAAYLSLDDNFTKPQIDEARQLLENNGTGLKTVSYKLYPAETTNYNTLAAQVVQSNAQVVVLGTEDVPSLSSFMKYFRLHHYNPEAIIASSGPDQGDAFLQAIGNGNNKDTAFEHKMAEGMFVPNDGWYPQIQTFQNDIFKQLWQAANPGQDLVNISSDTVQGFSSAQVLQQAVEATHSLDNSVLKNYLHSSHTFNSLQGPVKFDAQGHNTTSIAYLFQWQNGHLIPVYPASNAQANPEFPKSPWP